MAVSSTAMWHPGNVWIPAKLRDPRQRRIRHGTSIFHQTSTAGATASLSLLAFGLLAHQHGRRPLRWAGIRDAVNVHFHHVANADVAEIGSTQRAISGRALQHTGT